ncbi:hypothetical protein [Nocardia cyriacigeorgica]|nr:hypothetical protein [Nocardia cyriacigeorgica]MBF6088637.1 hypothetical protein [Nocardia cyriacigeorgica]MBF6093230.1 hypothetical protein [Nocardia cyriacigeorgica]MBF6157380.1 hypothetical protein [Nocardia cyriacigeorgica]MBF6196351.1 hypothetical protein [Nocardia cyriacigeorgica]MBF6346139.1 hypothetical protein [Nocardia cyriacigeorgica]
MGTSRFQRHSRIAIAAAAVLLAKAGCDGDAVLPTTTPLPVQVSMR